MVEKKGWSELANRISRRFHTERAGSAVGRARQASEHVDYRYVAAIDRL